MPFIVIIHDNPANEHLRSQAEQAHYAWLDANEEKILMRGGMKREDDTAFMGGVLILDVATRAAAEKFVADDPYAKVGLHQSVTIRPFQAAYSAPPERWF